MVAFVLEFSIGVRISTIPGLSLKNIVLYGLIVALFVVNKAKYKPIIAPNKINTPIVLFIVYCFLSMMVTYLMKVVPEYSLLKQFIFLKSFMDPYVLFILTYSILHDEKSIKNLLFAMVILLVVFLAITSLSAFDILSVSRATVDDKWGRTRGAFAEANQFAAYLAAFIPLLLAFLFTNKAVIKRFFYSGVLVLALFVLLLTGSRGGLVSLTVAIGVYYLLHSKKDLAKSLFNLFGIYLIAVIVVAMVFFILPDNTASGLLSKISGDFVEESNTDYSSGRLTIWTYALEKFISSPIFGTGWQTFLPLFGANSHSDYILFLITTGVVGLYLFCRIYYRMYKSVMEVRKRDKQYMQFYNAYISGLVAYMVSMVFVNLYNPTYFFMLYSALVLKLGAIASEKDDKNMGDEVVEAVLPNQTDMVGLRSQSQGTNGSVVLK